MLRLHARPQARHLLLNARGAVLRWELALVAIAAIWGATFVLVQDAVAAAPPMQFLAIRFALATAVMALAGAFRGTTPGDLRAGGLAGLALFAGYAFQTVGLQYTSASNAGFLTGMFVVFTPVLGAAALRVLPSRAATAGVVLAATGMVLLTMPSGLTIGKGDGLEILTAIAFAVHILVLSRVARARSALRLAAVQLAVVTVITTLWSALGERQAVSGRASVWFAAAFTAMFATALAFFVQTRAQQILPPVRTAVILAAEPVFAGITGYAVAGDRLGARGITGALLIVGGIVVAALLAPAHERL